jgi:hypothetical protein
MGWAHGSDLGLGRRPKLHGMQALMPGLGSPCPALKLLKTVTLRSWFC